MHRLLSKLNKNRLINLRTMSYLSKYESKNNFKIVKTDDEWKEQLNSQEYNILRNKGTEAPSTGKYDKYYPKSGYFACTGCNSPLFSAQAKFNSGCGWPAFDKCYKDALVTQTDTSFGQIRIEIMCGSCEGHLGHVFANERFTDTNERHCVNSISIKYVDKEPNLQEDTVLKNSKM